MSRTGFDGLLRKLYGDRVPIQLYHYTRPDGFLGIIRTKTIWATDIRYLNDSAEYRYASNLFDDRLRARAAKTNSRAERNCCAKLRAQLAEPAKVRLCAASFSENGDLLSQWRGYCLGGGFAIGVDAQRLASSTQCLLIPCEYDPDRQIALADEVIDRAFRAMIRHADQELRRKRLLGVNEAFARLKPIASDYINSFLLLAAALKHPSFSEEREWRLYRPDPPHVLHRSGLGGLVPYVELPLHSHDGLSLIRDVIVGPSPHMQLAHEAAASFLAQESIRDATVRKSAVPFRSLT